MDEALKTALNQPDIDDTLLSAAEHADMTMRKYVWRECKPKAAKIDRELMVGDKTAEDFVNEALKRLCDGTRSFNSQRGLLENLNSITDSLIWSEKKSSDRTGVVDFRQLPGESEDWNDPLANKSSNELSADATLIQNEHCETQRKYFEMIKASFDGDKETQNYLDALSQGFFGIDEISTLTDMPPAKIYEIRRKLKKYAPRFFGVSNFTELERKIENP
jgi:hypothetical protein